MIADRIEERLISGVLQAGALGAGDRAVERARQTGLEDDGRDFYRPSFGALWSVMCEMADGALDLSPLSVAAELRRRGAAALGPLDELHGADEPRLLDVLHRLAHEPFAYVSGVARFAALVHEAGERRRAEEISSARPGPQPERSGPGVGGTRGETPTP